MFIVEYLGGVFSAILIGYLAFTNVLAGVIHDVLSPQDALETNQVTTADDVLAGLSMPPDTYLPEERGGLPRILLENRAYQEASVAAGKERATELFEIEKEIPEYIEDALVNLYCEFWTEDYKRTTTGTGFFIHERGVILTNAHVAQFLLLENIPSVLDAHCTVRTGSPASPQYVAELLYLPPTWIRENAKLVSVEHPSGTGERDYALLYISDAVGTTTLPETFPSLHLETALLSKNTKDVLVYAAGYPAERVHTHGSNVPLIPMVGTTTVHDLYTFGSNYADVFSIRDSVVGEQGVSGGPVVRENGNAIGLIVTKGSPDVEGIRSLRALTLSYIDRTIREETRYSLQQNTLGDLPYRGKIFEEALAPFLSQLLAFEFE